MGIELFPAIKLTILSFLMLSALVFWLWTRDLTITLVFYAAVLLDSVALGYIDIFFAPSLITALWTLQRRRWVWFSFFFAIACLTKWQPLIIAPFLAVYLLGIEDPRRWRAIPWKELLLKALLPGAAVLALVVLIFQPQPVWLAFKASTSHDYLSGNALNANWIYTHILHVARPNDFGGLTNHQSFYIQTSDPAITTLPRLAFLVSYLVVLVLFFLRKKSFANLLLYASTGFLAYYTFNTGVHENHLFTLMLLVCALLWLEKERWLFPLLVIIINNLNLFVFYGVDGELHFPRLFLSLDIALPLAVFNVAFFLVMLGWLAARKNPG